MSDSISSDEILKHLSQPFIFGECLDYTGCVIEGDLRAADQIFFGVNFTGATFTGVVELSNCKFQGLSWFNSAKFLQKVKFHSVEFSNDARFDKSRFHHDAAFEHSDFRGMAVFDRASFGGMASFPSNLFNGNFSAEHTRFDQHADLDNSILMGGIWITMNELECIRNLASENIYGRIEYCQHSNP